MLSGNPLFNEQAYEKAISRAQRSEGVMTLQGTINKALFLLLICMTSGVLGFRNWEAWAEASPYFAFGGLVLALIIIFFKKTAPLLAPFYAAAEGIFVGMLSGVMDSWYQGISSQAVCLTLLVFLLMLFIYKTGIIEVTRNFAIGVTAATGAVVLFYFGCFGFFLVGLPVAYLTDSSTTNLVISIVICGIASLNFLLNFKFIDTLTSEVTAPKYLEWYAAFSLVVTLVWLYLEILRFLGRGRSR